MKHSNLLVINRIKSVINNQRFIKTYIKKMLKYAIIYIISNQGRREGVGNRGSCLRPRALYYN
jgi:hypothetical protein